MDAFDLFYLLITVGGFLAAASICGIVSEVVLPALKRLWVRRRKDTKEGDGCMNVSKKLTSKSGVTIPKHVRGEAGLWPGMAVDIETTPEGVLIRKHTPTCRFCGSVQDVLTVQGVDICVSCAKTLRKELDHIGA